MTPAMSPTDVLKCVCKLMKKPSPKYITIPEGGGCKSYVKIKDRQYAGRIGRSLAEARAIAARNALKEILLENSDLKKNTLVQEYLARSEDYKEVRVLEPSELCMKYAEALMAMRDVKVCVLLKAMRRNRNKVECEKFLAMSKEERSKWLETL